MIFTLVSERHFLLYALILPLTLNLPSKEFTRCMQSPLNQMKRSDLLCFNASMSTLWKIEKTMVGQEFPPCIDVFTHKAYMYLLESVVIRREFHKELERPIMKWRYCNCYHLPCLRGCRPIFWCRILMVAYYYDRGFKDHPQVCFSWWRVLMLLKFSVIFFIVACRDAACVFFFFFMLRLSCLRRL